MKSVYRCFSAFIMTHVEILSVLLKIKYLMIIFKNDFSVQLVWQLPNSLNIGMKKKAVSLVGPRDYKDKYGA